MKRRSRFCEITGHVGVKYAVPVIIYDLPAKDGETNGTIKKAITQLKKLKPTPLASPDLLAWIEPANFTEDLARLAECDLVIEVIVERMSVKRDLYARIAPHIHDDAVLVSNTSGLSINALAEALPATLRQRFCGMHFFNPPRYMHLVELIPAQETLPGLVDKLETFLTTRLGKGVIRAFDTPNFIANRIGTFAIVATMHHTAQFHLGFDEVDALTGTLIGRPKSGTYRLLDVIGLDTFANVLGGLPELLAGDPWQNYFQVPKWLEELVAKGALGQKAGSGIYRKDGKEVRVLDLVAGNYRAPVTHISPQVEQILSLKDPSERFKQLRACDHPHAMFLWAILRDLYHYCAVHLATIAGSARDIDFAMRWGYGWTQGPFETWQAAGWQPVAAAIAEDIASGSSLTDVALPNWVVDGRQGVHEEDGSYSSAAKSLIQRSQLPVYARQIDPQHLLGEATGQTGTTIFETKAVRLWHLNSASNIPILSLLSKGGTLGPDVIEDMLEAIQMAERNFDGLVIWRPEAQFSFGADLKLLQPMLQAGDWSAVGDTVARFQHLTRAIKYAQIPVVAAVSGMALGGGCEIVMHCASVVASMEAQLGLVEAGVGLIPAGGGCKELVLRASRCAEGTVFNEPLQFVQKVFPTILKGMVAQGAYQAKRYGLLGEADVIVPHPDEVLYVAIVKARSLAEECWRPPLPGRNIQVIGLSGLGTLEMSLLNLREGGMMSAHDYQVGRSLAIALCGGEIESGTLVDEDWLLAVERREFVELIKTEPTEERIDHMLKTGKSLRN